MVAITGRGLRVELGGCGAGQAAQVAGHLDHHALQPEAQPQRRDLVLSGVAQRAELALDAADAEPARNADPVHVGQGPAAPAGVSQESEAIQRMCTLAWLANPPARSASETLR